MSRIFLGILAVLLAVGVAVLAMAAYDPPLNTRNDSRFPPKHLDVENRDSACVDLQTTDNRMLHDQVSLCNLINALWLEENQLEDIINVLERHLPDVEALAGELLLAADNPGFGKSMTDLRDTLMKGEEANDRLREDVNSYAGPNHGMRLDFNALRREAAVELLPILSENQLVLLAEYKPCLFNVDDPLHPENVGQVSAASKGVKILERLRSAPPEMVSDRLDGHLRRLAEHAYKDTPFDINIDTEIKRLRAIANEAMSLSDEEFAMRAEELALELTAYHEAKDQMMADHYNIPTGSRDRRIDKLANTIVIPGAVEIFQAELASRVS